MYEYLTDVAVAALTINIYLGRHVELLSCYGCNFTSYGHVISVLKYISCKLKENKRVCVVVYRLCREGVSC